MPNRTTMAMKGGGGMGGVSVRYDYGGEQGMAMEPRRRDLDTRRVWVGVGRAQGSIPEQHNQASG